MRFNTPCPLSPSLADFALPPTTPRAEYEAACENEDAEKECEFLDRAAKTVLSLQHTLTASECDHLWCQQPRTMAALLRLYTIPDHAATKKFRRVFTGLDNRSKHSLTVCPSCFQAYYDGKVCVCVRGFDVYACICACRCS